jgi:phosphatidate cytidylyltransferase
VSDWRDDERNDEPGLRAAPGEGVRIVGPDPESRRPAAPPTPSQGGGRFPMPGEEPGWSDPAQTPRRDSTGSSRLPHWTDPPTGEVPRSLGGDNANDDFETWSSMTGPSRPRFRTDTNDWNAGDFSGGELSNDDGTMIGDLGGEGGEYEEAWGPPRRGSRSGRSRGGRGRGRGQPSATDRTVSGSGHLEGPPTDADEPQELGGSELGQRVITGVVMAAIALACFVAGRPVAAFLVTVVIGVCAFELYEAFRRAGYHTATVIGLLGCVAIVPIAYNEGERAFPLVSFLVITFAMLWYLFEVVRQRPVVNIALTVLTFAYIGVLGGFAGLLLAGGGAVGGTGLLGGVVICAIGSDVVAFFAGRSFGHTPLMPNVSPHKTVEGLIAGAIAAVVLGGFVGALLHPWATKGVGAGLALGLVVAVTAPIGDLVESMIKRDLHVKDLGGVLPGHGGFLDRFDAMLFALPAAYYLAIYIFTH